MSSRWGDTNRQNNHGMPLSCVEKYEHAIYRGWWSIITRNTWYKIKNNDRTFLYWMRPIRLYRRIFYLSYELHSSNFLNSVHFHLYYVQHLKTNSLAHSMIIHQMNLLMGSNSYMYCYMLYVVESLYVVTGVSHGCMHVDFGTFFKFPLRDARGSIPICHWIIPLTGEAHPKSLVLCAEIAFYVWWLPGRFGDTYHICFVFSRLYLYFGTALCGTGAAVNQRM